MKMPVDKALHRAKNREGTIPEDKINKLVIQFNQGKYKQVYEKATSLIRKYPKSFMLWNLIGAACMQLREDDRASYAFRQVSNLNPNFTGAYNNLGVLLARQEKYDEAIDAYNEVLSINSHDAFAYYNLGNAYFKLRNFDAALQSYEKAVLTRNDYVQPYNGIGCVHLALENYDLAISAYRKALELWPDYIEVYSNLAAALTGKGELEEALDMCEKSILMNPRHVASLYIKGNILLAKLKYRDAIISYMEAIKINSNHIESHLGIATCHKELHDFPAALQKYEEIINLDETYAQAYVGMAQVLVEMDLEDDACNFFNKAIALENDNIDAYIGLGNIFSQKGDVSEATKFYEIAHAKNALDAIAIFNLVDVKSSKISLEQISDIKSLLDDGATKNKDKCTLYYAYGKILEEAGELKEAFESYVAGGAIKQKLLSYNPQHDDILFEKVREKAQMVHGLSFIDGEAECLRKPIFIFGMPRSGTTLIEQILSSHSEVHGGGELKDLNDLIAPYLWSNEKLNITSLIDIRVNYLGSMTRRAINSLWSTDKMPQNFLHMSFIASCFPEAKVLHVKRDPGATCWSNFKHNFHSKGLGYSYNLCDTVAYYKKYRDLMAFWDNLFPNKIHHVDYDALTKDPDTEIRNLLQHIGLIFEESCLSPQNNKRSVKTASQYQVRAEIYSGSSQSWRKFEPYLNGIFDELYE